VSSSSLIPLHLFNGLNQARIGLQLAQGVLFCGAPVVVLGKAGRACCGHQH
jgi:hypothetical protein